MSGELCLTLGISNNAQLYLLETVIYAVNSVMQRVQDIALMKE